LFKAFFGVKSARLFPVSSFFPYPLGFRYAGLQNSYRCYCGSGDLEINGGLAPEKDCDSSCQRDPTQTCGGYNRLSVYEFLPTMNGKHTKLMNQ